ncbi:hypothetical protein [Streptomyces nondiastaticus]
MDAAYAAWRPYADTEPKEGLHTGSGWGALEAERGHYDLPGTPFPVETLGEEQEPWLRFLRTGSHPSPDRTLPPPPSLVSPQWRELLETTEGADLCGAYHLGVARWHTGDRSQAVRAWEGAEHLWFVKRCLAYADAEDGHPGRAADRYLEAVEDACGERRAGASWTAALAGLGEEAVEALLAAGRVGDAEAVLDRLGPGIGERGRFRLLRARVLLALGDAAAAREVFDRGIEVEDLREGDESLGETWYAIEERLLAGDGPVTAEIRARARAKELPAAYDFRMRPAP